MKQSEKLKSQHNQLRKQTIAEIMLLVKKHKDIEMAVEFTEPIFYGQGFDEQDNAPEIEEITDSGLAIVFHQGSMLESINLERLDTEKLIEIVDGLEKSFEDAKKFAGK